MEKVYITFGNAHLQELKGKLNPMDVILEVDSREDVLYSFIGDKFATSYSKKEIDRYINEFGGTIYTLQDLYDILNADKEQKYKLGQTVYFISNGAEGLKVSQATVVSAELKDGMVYYNLGTYPVKQALLFGSRKECAEYYIKQLENEMRNA